jgi:hypothetical protein
LTSRSNIAKGRVCGYQSKRDANVDQNQSQEGRKSFNFWNHHNETSLPRRRFVRKFSFRIFLFLSDFSKVSFLFHSAFSQNVFCYANSFERVCLLDSLEEVHLVTTTVITGEPGLRSMIFFEACREA